MFRRRLLACGVAALAGCGLAPESPSTIAAPVGPPNVFATFEWLADRSAYRVTVDYGSTITPENTGRLSVTTVRETTTWVSGRADDDPAAPFPLSPGASVVHPVSEPATVRVVWEPPGDAGADISASLDHWPDREQPAFGGRTAATEATDGETTDGTAGEP